MRILLACEFYFPSVGGVQEVMRQIAERLAARGHTVTVATTRLPGRQSAEINGVHIVEFDVSGNSTRGLHGDVGAYRDYVLNSTHDIFMVKAAQQWTFDALLPIVGRIPGAKIFIPCGFSGFYEPEFADYFRRLPAALREFDHLIFYASDYRDINFAKEHGFANISIVPNGASEREFSVPADPGFRQRHGIDADAFVILTVGTLSGMKGHQELAEAFALASLEGRQAVLFLNGNRTPGPFMRGGLARRLGVLRSLYQSGRLSKAWRKMAGQLLERLRLSGVAVRLGYEGREPLAAVLARINRSAPAKRAMLVDLPREELVQAYLNSDLFVFASNIEYSPLVLYEAAAAGLPFLSVPVGNAAEIAQWTAGGAICPARRDADGTTHVEPAVLAEHIERLAADPETRAALGAAGRRNWAQRFTWQAIAGQYEQIFATLLKNKQLRDGVA